MPVPLSTTTPSTTRSSKTMPDPMLIKLKTSLTHLHAKVAELEKVEPNRDR